MLLGSYFCTAIQFAHASAHSLNSHPTRSEISVTNPVLTRYYSDSPEYAEIEKEGRTEVETDEGDGEQEDRDREGATEREGEGAAEKSASSSQSAAKPKQPPCSYAFLAELVNMCLSAMPAGSLTFSAPVKDSKEKKGSQEKEEVDAKERGAGLFRLHTFTRTVPAIFRD